MATENTILECIFDIHFDSNTVSESLLGDIANVEKFTNIIKLPLHQVPEAIRKNDPNLKLQPLYEIKSNQLVDYRIMLGDNTIGLSVNNNYDSWEKSFFPKIKELFTTILKTGKLSKINRIGLRYVDFLENENIFLTGKINIDINKKDTSTKTMFLRIEDSEEGISYNKVITNNSKSSEQSDTGSIIDIVTFKDNQKYLIDDNFDYEVFFNDINKLHTVNENKFKEVISDEQAKKYNLLQ